MLGVRALRVEVVALALLVGARPGQMFIGATLMARLLLVSAILGTVTAKMAHFEGSRLGCCYLLNTSRSNIWSGHLLSPHLRQSMLAADRGSSHSEALWPGFLDVDVSQWLKVSPETLTRSCDRHPSSNAAEGSPGAYGQSHCSCST